MRWFALCSGLLLSVSWAQAAPSATTDSGGSLFEAFQHFCVETEVRFAKIEERINLPNVKIRNRRDFQGERTSDWQLFYNGRAVFVKAHTGPSEFYRRSNEYCVVAGTAYEDGSVLTLRKWLGLSAFVPSVGWWQDFDWQKGRPLPMSEEAAHQKDAEGQVVWHIEVSGGKSTVGTRISATEFKLYRFTNPGSRN